MKLWHCAGSRSLRPLWALEEMGLDYVYLGYWIRGCRKMAYKSDFRPLEIYINSRWTTLL